MTSHLNLDGAWIECAHPKGCKLLFHLEMSAAEAAAIPLVTLLPLFEAVQPCTEISVTTGAKLWFDSRHRLNRDYGLPAGIMPSGTMEWFVRGSRHRLYGPALVFDNGDTAWYLNGQPHRADGPAKTWVSGVEEWWVHGRELKTDTQIGIWKAHLQVMAARS